MRGVIHLFVFLLLAGMVSAIGISLQHMVDGTFQMLPGESVLFKITLQNGGDDNLTVNLTMASDDDIAYIIDYQDSYSLPARTYDLEVFLNITIPEDAELLDMYHILISMVPIIDPEDVGGTVPMNSKINRQFDVLVVDVLGETKRPIVTIEPDIPAGTEQEPDIFQEHPTEPEPDKDNVFTERVLPLLVIIAICLLVLILWNKSSKLSRRIVGDEHKPVHATGAVGGHTAQHPPAHSTGQTAPHSVEATHMTRKTQVHQASTMQQVTQEHMDKLKHYVQHSLDRGCTPESIRLALFEKGWQKMIIDGILPQTRSQVYQSAQERYTGLQKENTKITRLQRERIHDMLQYIGASISKGISPGEIESSLMEVGWDPAYVRKGIDYMIKRNYKP